MKRHTECSLKNPETTVWDDGAGIDFLKTGGVYDEGYCYLHR